MHGILLPLLQLQLLLLLLIIIITTQNSYSAVSVSGNYRRFTLQFKVVHYVALKARVNKGVLRSVSELSA